MSVNDSRSNMLGPAKPLDTGANGLLYPGLCLFDDEYLQTSLAEQARAIAELKRDSAEQKIFNATVHQDLCGQVHQLREDLMHQKAKNLQFHGICDTLTQKVSFLYKIWVRKLIYAAQEKIVLFSNSTALKQQLLSEFNKELPIPPPGLSKSVHSLLVSAPLAGNEVAHGRITEDMDDIANAIFAIDEQRDSYVELFQFVYGRDPLYTGR